MSKPANSSNLPDDFFDSDKKSKKEQQDELAKEFEKFEEEMAALQAESEEQLREEFEKLQEEKNMDELDQQIVQWKRMVELEKRAEELKNKPTTSERPPKKFKNSPNTDTGTAAGNTEPAEEQDLDDIEDFEDKLSNWRSKGL